MTNSEITGILIDLVGANLHAHKLIGDLIERLPREQQDPYIETLHNALKANAEAFEKLKKAISGNG